MSESSSSPEPPPSVADDEVPTIVSDGPPVPSLLDAPSLPGGRSLPSVGALGASVEVSDGSTLHVTATEAVRDEQAARGGAIIRVGIAVSAVAIVALQLPRGQHPVGRWLATLALAAVFCASLLAYAVERRDTKIDPRQIFYLSLVNTPALVVITGHAGVMSPACFAFIFGIYYFGMSDEKHEGWVCLGISSVGYAALAVLTIVGVLRPEHALFPLATMDPLAVGAMAVVVILMFCATFWLARLSRTATIGAMQRLEQAQRQIRQRDALLREANQDLELALGGRGRFTGRQLGDYAVGHVLGRGAMGEVYAARHRGTNAPAAIKVLHAYMTENRTHVERFFREAEVTSSLASPNIVAVLGHGIAEDGSPFLVMELIDGHDLGWHLRERRRFSIADTVRAVADIARGLSAAEDAGIVHRDIKPKNVVYDEKAACWKVLDFGVSKIHASSGTLTHGDVIGTPAYMAPEQAKSGRVDHRADVFSLGVIAYRLLTGRPAFSARDALATMYQVATRQPAQPSSQARIPPDLDLVLALALAKDPERRLRSANTFAAALRDAARGQLDERFRRDATLLLAEQPWGRTIDPPEPRSTPR